MATVPKRTFPYTPISGETVGIFGRVAAHR
jgi:hypothetical protein